jgi:predicted transcriptional regulator of viral defense system
MSILRAYDRLESLDGLVTTGEAAAALRVSSSSASRTLGTLAKQGRAVRIRSGLWHIGPGHPIPTSIVRDLCRPYPAYVSFLTALNIAGAIDQRPRVISVASLDRARTIETSVGTFAVHHLPPALFGGWEETSLGPIATPEKAVFDLCYVTAVTSGKPPRLPELDLPRAIKLASFDPWLSGITSARIRSVTAAALRHAIGRSHAR